MLYETSSIAGLASASEAGKIKPSLRALFLAIAASLVMSCTSQEDEHKAAAERGRALGLAGKKQAEQEMAARAMTLKSNRDEIFAKLNKLIASRDWGAASTEAAKWRDLGDREMVALAVTIEQAKGAEEQRKAQATRIADEKARRELERADRARRKKEGVSIGMNQDEVVGSSWGRPEKINRSIYSFGTREQWVYPGSQYLYFDNGKLTSIQTSR